jgi:hypothetical protein
MKTPIHLKRRGHSYFHLNPLHAMLSLASFMLAVLIVLMLVPSAR